jgi:hypothetical protein
MGRAKPSQLILATTKARICYSNVRYEKDAYIIFGKESAGLPAEIRARYPESCVRIPMLDGRRSLNLSNAAAVCMTLRGLHTVSPGKRMAATMLCPLDTSIPTEIAFICFLLLIDFFRNWRTTLYSLPIQSIE